MGYDISKVDEAYRIALKADIARESFRHFIEFVAPKYEFNWHHLILIDALQRLAERQYHTLIVMMPPRHGKSQLVSILFPAWCFARNPAEKVILGSYAIGLASRMNLKCQDVMASNKFTELFPKISFQEDKEVGQVRTSHKFDVSGGGHYIAAGVGGGITGEGCTVGIKDDLVKNSEQADSVTYREKIWEWDNTTFSTRYEPGSIEVNCATRWHEDDPIGRMLEQDMDGVEVLRLPALCEVPDQYRALGEALWPGTAEKPWYPRDWLLKRKERHGSRAWNALYQQRPAPDEGSIIKRQWFQYYNPREYKIEGKRVNFYFDTAYTEKEKNDPTAGIAYVKEGANFYILECTAEWLDFSGQIQLVKDFTARNGYSPSSIIRVEPKATGISLVQVMKKETGLNVTEGKPPKGDKVARAHSCEGTLEGGRVYLPDGMTWVGSFLDECAAFPNAAHDDRVDCLTGMIISELNNKPGVRFA